MTSHEKELYKSRIHPKVLFKPLLIQVLLLVLHVLLIKWLPKDTGWDWYNSWGALILHGIVVALEIWYVLVPALRWWNTEFTLTNRRVKADWGILYKQSREIDLQRIASISEERGILDRIFSCGSLNFYDAAAEAQPHTSGAWNRPDAQAGVRFHDIPKVKQVREMVEQAKYSVANGGDAT